MSKLDELIKQLPDTIDGLNWSISRTLKGRYRVYYGLDFVEADTLIEAIEAQLRKDGSNEKD